MHDRSKVPSGYKFHHIGYATDSIDRERKFLEILGYRIEGSIFADLRQGINGCFMIGSGPRIELLENSAGSNTLTPWIDAGIKMYHIAYWVNRIDEALDWARGQRARVVAPPVPAPAFNGRLIAFVIFRNGQMMEFIERDFEK